MLVFLDTQSAEQGGRITFGVPALHFGKLFFQFSRPHAVGIGEIGFHVNGLFFMLHSPQLVMPHHHCIEYSIGVKFEVVLLQHRQAFAGSELDAAPRWIDLTGQHPK